MTALTVRMEPTTVVLGGVLALTFLWWLSTRRPKGLPPGPGPALPLLGHLHLLSMDPRKQFAAWRRKYGDIFCLYLGGRPLIILNGFNVIKEALVKNADAFSDRPHMFFTDLICDNKGVLATSGTVWKEQRKVSLEILREMGVGKNILAEKIQDEVSQYIEAVAAYKGRAFDLGELTHSSVSNNICSIVFGKRFEYEDPVFKRYLVKINENVKSLGATSAINIFPFLRHIPGDRFKAKRVLANVADIEKDFISPQLKKHLDEHTDDNASDFIHSYIREIRKHQGGSEATSINESNLFKVMGDLFVAGTETTATSILWTVLIFLHHPDVQEKCYEEIKHIVGTERAPNMRDKLELTYMEATIMEMQRWANIAPLGVWYGLAHDAIFQGYKFPKDAIVLPNLNSVLHDPELWDNPQDFRPDRFIGPEGKLCRPEQLIPFGIGRRICLGKSLARMELFLYLTTMIQRFRFLPPEGEPLPSLEGIMGIAYSPKPFKVRALPRDADT